MKNFLWILPVGLFVILLIVGLNQPKNGSTEQSAGAPAIAASDSQLQSACQSIADSQLRGGAYESTAYNSTNLQPSSVSDDAHYDSAHSTCVFTENITTYPSATATLDGAVKEDSQYLYSAAIKPDGVLQDMQAVGWCIHKTYQYPKTSTEDNCVDFQLQQTGAGTSNYKVSNLGVGVKISPDEFAALVKKYIP
jgi:hypothetical protein